MKTHTKYLSNFSRAILLDLATLRIVAFPIAQLEAKPDGPLMVFGFPELQGEALSVPIPIRLEFRTKSKSANVSTRAVEMTHNKTLESDAIKLLAPTEVETDAPAIVNIMVQKEGFFRLNIDVIDSLNKVGGTCVMELVVEAGKVWIGRGSLTNAIQNRVLHENHLKSFEHLSEEERMTINKQTQSELNTIYKKLDN